MGIFSQLFNRSRGVIALGFVIEATRRQSSPPHRNAIIENTFSYKAPTLFNITFAIRWLPGSSRGI